MAIRAGIRIRNLNVWIKEKHILKNISLDIKPGAITAVMGPSGSGKSTLLRTINRLIELVPGARVEGRIELDGVDIYKTDPYTLRRRIGMVFQTPNPFPHLSIYDNVAIGAKLNGIAKNRKELDRIVEWALKTALLWDEVKDRLYEPPTGLSGGQQQRLCLARALAVKPDALLLDEPTANIDPVNARKLEETIVNLSRREGMTIVIVTHMPQQAARISDHIAFIYNGELVEAGPTREIILRPKSKLTEQFLKGEV